MAKLDHLNIDLDGDGIPERYELGGGGNANEREIAWEDYKNLSEEEQNNGTTYYVPDAPGGGSGGSSGGSSKHEYSEEEKIVGTWIDGRPIYERTFRNLNFSMSTSWRDTGVEIPNIDEVIDYIVYQIDDTNKMHVYKGCFIRAYGDKVQSWNNGSIGNMKIATISYIKTTD